MSLPPLISVEELFADPVFSGASISPDGSRLAYLAPKEGRLSIWVRGIDQEHEDAVCVAHDSRRGIHTYYWTHDPQWLLFLQDTDGNEDWHLYRVDLDDPQRPAVDLTPLPPGSRVWSVEPFKALPGSVLVTMNQRPMFFEPYVVDVATGGTTRLRENESMLGQYLFGPGGETYFAGLTEDGSAFEYYAIEGASDARRLIARVEGDEYPMGTLPLRVAPDGKGLLVGLYHGSDDLQLVRLDAETGQTTVVAGMPGRNICTAAHVAPGLPPSVFTCPSTGEVIAVRFVGDRPHIQVVDPDFEEVYAALSRLSDGVLAAVSSDDAGRRWVAVFEHDRDPALTYLYDRDTGESRLLFRPHPDLDPMHLAPMVGVSITARDGLPLHGFLTLPVGVEPAGLPLILRVHGGPWFHDIWRYDPEAQFLANRGYAVLQVNFRGSSGYGKRHTTAAIGEFAGAMHDDLIDAAEWAVKQGYADPTRIGIYGGSYGGYATLVGVTVTPDFFAAAVNNCGISSLNAFLHAPSEWARPSMANNWFRYVGDPTDPEQAADMLARSPITMVDRIRTPLLVVHGAKDPRVAISEADNIVEALTSRQVPVEYLVADDEGHGFRNPENKILMYRAMERHFAQHLGGRCA